MFRTEIPLIPYPQQLSQSARLLTVGSCFAETIGSRLTEYKVDTLANPFGTVFNPLAACQLLRAAVGEEVDWQQHLVEARGRWQSYDLHASIGEESPVALLQHIQELLGRTGDFLRTADVVVLTLGTAWAYRLHETGELVNNCHKVPAEKFTKELLTPDEIVNAVAETHAYLRRVNPDLRFILTVSPVRHLKDTLTLNSASKSTLRVACHYLSELLPDVSYFPAYELLLDDLRDYRFYAEDMLHPSKVAEEYIWERFTRTYFDAAFGRFKKEWHSLQQALAHRPLYAAAPEHRQFLEGVLARLEQLTNQVAVQQEIADVQERLANLPVPVVPVPLPEEEDDEERIDIGDYAPILEVEAAVAVDALLTEGLTEETEEVDLEETVETEEASAVAPASGNSLPTSNAKKKRRSRGGAKRTARKRAALAALEAEAMVTITDAEPSTETPATAPEAQLLPPIATEAVVPVPAEPDTETAPIESPDITAPSSSTLSKSRRGRSAGQILADQKKRRGSRKPSTANSAAVIDSAPAAEAPQPATANPAPPTLLPTPQPETVPTAETPAPTPARDEPVRDEPIPVPDEIAVPLPTEPEVPPITPVDTDVSAPAPPQKARAPRKKPAAKASVAPEETVSSEEPTSQTEPSSSSEAPTPKSAKTAAKTAKPRAARKKPVAKATSKKTDSPTPETSAATETPAAPPAPKRRSPRKKPTPTDETPSAS